MEVELTILAKSVSDWSANLVRVVAQGSQGVGASDAGAAGVSSVEEEEAEEEAVSSVEEERPEEKGADEVRLARRGEVPVPMKAAIEVSWTASTIVLI